MSNKELEQYILNKVLIVNSQVGNYNNSEMFGIEAVQFYFPKTYVEQSQYQKFKKVSEGKYTRGLGQLGLSFTYPFEDVNSMALTVVRNLLINNSIKPESVGRLQVGTETLFDKSKSTKTILMSLFQSNHDIEGIQQLHEGATSINACYGATNALINTLNWIASSFWDGRYGIVVATDIAVYDEGPARCTGGAGAIALLIGPKPKISVSNLRSTYIDNQYDFYKPQPNSQYPTVDGKLSIECYLKAVTQCYKKLKQKEKGKNILKQTDFYCFHCPFYKMVQKAFEALMKEQNTNNELITSLFMQKVHPTLYFCQRLGNIYTGSVLSCLISLFFTAQSSLIGKNILLFSYGSGLCSSMLQLHITGDLLSTSQKDSLLQRLKARVKISPQEYTEEMKLKQSNYGKFKGIVPVRQQLISPNTFYLHQIDTKWRRTYKLKPQMRIARKNISQRLQNLNQHMTSIKQFSKFYKLTITERINIINNHSNIKLDTNILQTGGLTNESANGIGENVIGKLALPYSVCPNFVINDKNYIVPMCTEESSVVAACNSASKFIAPYSFYSSSTPNIMIGQIHLPSLQIDQAHKLLAHKQQIIATLNSYCESMIKRGGGVTDFRVREIKQKQHVAEIYINVCEAMGANITNTLCQKGKQLISKIGIKTGIAVLTNYCIERRAFTYFQIPIRQMGWKNVNGQEVVKKILQAQKFAQSDRFRAATHNKGIMNGIDSVCVATGQDWRAVQSAAHVYASRNGSEYLPLTNYKVIVKNQVQYFRGSIQIPISVGAKGGALHKNPIYKTSFEMMGNPSAQQLGQIMVTVGLAQNFAAMRALAIEGIQKGHMNLHAKSIAQEVGVPKELLDDAALYMNMNKKYTRESALQFLKIHHKAKL